MKQRVREIQDGRTRNRKCAERVQPVVAPRRADEPACPRGQQPEQYRYGWKHGLHVLRDQRQVRAIARMQHRRNRRGEVKDPGCVRQQGRDRYSGATAQPQRTPPTYAPDPRRHRGQPVHRRLPPQRGQQRQRGIRGQDVVAALARGEGEEEEFHRQPAHQIALPVVRRSAAAGEHRDRGKEQAPGQRPDEDGRQVIEQAVTSARSARVRGEEPEHVLVQNLALEELAATLHQGWQIPRQRDTGDDRRPVPEAQVSQQPQVSRAPQKDQRDQAGQQRTLRPLGQDRQADRGIEHI